jgi:hypothetical protein
MFSVVGQVIFAKEIPISYSLEKFLLKLIAERKRV